MDEAWNVASGGAHGAPPDASVQWSKPVIADLRRERRAARFDVWELTKFIYGGEEALAKIEKTTRLAMSDPRLRSDDLWTIDRPTRYLRACERGRAFVELVRKHRLPFEERGPLELLLNEDLFILLHDIMFVGALSNLADDEQRGWWLDKALDYRILGTYAQTELTHGSNVRGLRTTATFTFPEGEGSSSAPEFVLNTPSLEATKWWPGGMARSCNCVIIMARLLLPAKKGGLKDEESSEMQYKDYGPHPFFLQIRDWNTHASLPGVELFDIGQKLGYNGMDNGGMRLDHVRIPRRNLLGRYVEVTENGEYFYSNFSILSHFHIIPLTEAHK